MALSWLLHVRWPRRVTHVRLPPCYAKCRRLILPRVNTAGGNVFFGGGGGGRTPLNSIRDIKINKGMKLWWLPPVNAASGKGSPPYFTACKMKITKDNVSNKSAPEFLYLRGPFITVLEFHSTLFLTPVFAKICS